ncbi:carboxypeptidase-like regulatory domain-containing protein [Kordia sp.]|uniref:carboxypeptidase-like regulatory domain-containing protein n=1 Tax=Kordia sp. TaxID=1965332 RepID=UPI003D6AE2F2
MKHPELIVQIPEPCHEDWGNMSPTEKGRFCNACTKEVIDFSAKSDEEVIKHFTNHGNLCGRFHASQLNRKLIADRKKRNHWLSYAATLLLPMTVFSQQTKSDEKKTTKTEQLEILKFKTLHISSLNRKAKVHSKKQQDSITIKGIITDDTGMPLPSATVLIKETSIGVTTDFDGNFSIKVKSGNVLAIMYVGYETKEITVKTSKMTYDVQLDPDGSLEEVVVVGYVVHSDEYVSKYASTHYPKPMTEEEVKERDARTKNYFTFQKKKWQEKRVKRRAERAARKAERQAKNNN